MTAQIPIAMTQHTTTKPFLKWAGGKYRLASVIRAALPQGRRLIEPFVGSGAVFLNMDYSSYVLADANQHLIDLFQLIKYDGVEFIDYCQSFFNGDVNSELVFYQRRELFNSTDDIKLKSALFIYLNRHCFNGLCRYNAKGFFNVPFGRYKLPLFPRQEILAFYKKSQYASFSASDFVETMEMAEKGDVIYCDPPYVPLSATASFTNYTHGGFGLEEQNQLAAMALKLSLKGIPVIISNHHTPFTLNAYKDARIELFDVQRFISSKAESRGKVSELLAIFS